jgi:hypothetical protein
VAQLDYLTTHTSISPIRRGFSPAFVNYKKGKLGSQPQENLQVVCPWSVVLSGYSASSTTITGRHDIAEILLKVALNTIKSINQNQ